MSGNNNKKASGTGGKQIEDVVSQIADGVEDAEEVAANVEDYNTEQLAAFARDIKDAIDKLEDVKDEAEAQVKLVLPVGESVSGLQHREGRQWRTTWDDEQVMEALEEYNIPPESYMRTNAYDLRDVVDALSMDAEEIGLEEVHYTYLSR